MSDIDNDENLVDLEVPDELTSLKARADLLGVKYHPSISLDKLRDKVNASVTVAEVVAPVETAIAEATEETVTQRRLRKRKEANELLRIRVVCMNPAKKEWEGELFTAGNSLVGSFTKFVPFDTEDGWHVPRIIYEQIAQRQCQLFTTIRDARGNSSRKGKLIREFSIEVMPQLTEKELTELARRQAMAKSVD